MPFITRTFSRPIGTAIEIITDYLVGFDKDIPVFGDRPALPVHGSDSYIQQTLALCRASNPDCIINYFA